MFEILKRKMKERKIRVIEENERDRERIAKQEKERRNKEAKELDMLSVEMDKYLNTINVPFILLPEASKGLLSILKARSTGGQYQLRLTEEDTHKLLTFFNDDFNIFIQMLEKKGFQLKGKESEFMETFISKVDEINDNDILLRYGHFAYGKNDLKEIIYALFEVIEAEDIYDVGVQKYLAKYLHNKGIYTSEPNMWDLFDKVKEYKEQFDIDYKIRMMEERLETQ